MIRSEPELCAGTGSSDGPIKPLLIVGVGNLLMGDEGVGIHVLRALEAGAPIEGAALLDGGTGGINLLEAISGAAMVIMIDATRDGQPAGTIAVLKPSCVADLPRGLSAHDFGVKDLFAAAALTGRFPEIHLFTVSVEEIEPMSLKLSAAVKHAVPEVARAVHALANRLLALTTVPE